MLILTAAGVAGGLATAAALGRFSRTLLCDVQPLDPASFAVATPILVTVTGVAALVPAYRAARVDRVAALKID